MIIIILRIVSLKIHPRGNHPCVIEAITFCPQTHPSVVGFVTLRPGLCNLPFCFACRLPVRLYLYGEVQADCRAGGGRRSCSSPCFLGASLGLVAPVGLQPFFTSASGSHFTFSQAGVISVRHSPQAQNSRGHHNTQESR